jgi:dienelactone hydrolase
VAAAEERVRALVDAYGGLAGLDLEVQRLPPTLILHGAADQVVPVSEAYQIEHFPQLQAIAHTMQTYPGARHGFEPADAQDGRRRVQEFFDAKLGGVRK